MENKAESTLENMIEYSTFKEAQSNPRGIRDFNNVETADRKLVLNSHLEFWIHDNALSAESDYFSYIFGKLNQSDLNNSINLALVNTVENDDFKQTSISIPHDEMFFDVLLWIYAKDAKKLKKAGKSFQHFLYLISLGIFLKMKEEFFEILLTDLKFDFKNEAFLDPLWSRTIFTFPILERIVNQMRGENYLKIVALLSWLKIIDQNTKEIQTNQEVIVEVLTSHDLFYVRNFIKRNQLMIGLTLQEIAKLKDDFCLYSSAFDSFCLLNNFIIGNKTQCIVCKQTFLSPFETALDMECKIKGEKNEELKMMFHPRCIIKNEKTICQHEGCRKKYSKTEFPCCHRKSESPNNTSFKESAGCQVGEEKHMLVFI